MRNKEGKTAEDILLTEKPEGWQEMLHWYRKFKPGTASWEASSHVCVCVCVCVCVQYMCM